MRSRALGKWLGCENRTHTNGINALNKVKVKVPQLCLTLCDPMDYKVHGNSPGQNTGVVSLFFFRGSFQPRAQTQVSGIADGFFTSWATREAQEYWSGQPIPSPANLPNPGIEPGSPALHVDSWPTELSGKPYIKRSQIAYLPLLPCEVVEIRQLWSRMWALTRYWICWHLDLGLLEL